jgi:predicted lipoprotein with Yx(FWY)xxD motif
MDLYTPGGAELEVKVTEKATNAVFILNKLNERKAWGNVANLVYIYILDNKSGDINFLSEYKYNGQRYVLCT